MDVIKPRKEDLPKVSAIIRDPKIVIWYRAKPALIDMMIKASDPRVTRIPASLRAILISGKGIMMDKEMVLKWYGGHLDEDNSFMLESGELFVRKENINEIDGVSAENANLNDDVLKRGKNG